MANITWIIFGIFVVSCSAQFGFRRNENFLQRQNVTPFRRMPPSFLNALQPGTEDKKCFTLARRLFYVSRMVHYPCDKRRPGIPVIRWFMGTFGPICVSYIREPIYRYYRVPLCCPGLAMDRFGKCTIKTNMPVQSRGRSNEEVMSMASKMRETMWQRARKDMERRRAMMFLSMRDRMRNNRGGRPTPFVVPPMPPRMAMRRPPMAPMFPAFNNRNPSLPKVAFLRFNRPTPPMPHPVQRPPVNGGVVKIIKRKLIPLFPWMQRNTLPFSLGKNKGRPPMVPRIVLSARADISPVTSLREFHPSIPRPPMQRMQPPFPQFAGNQDLSQGQFQEPAPQETQEGGSGNFMTSDGFHGHQDPSQHGDGFHGMQEGELSPEMQVDLPTDPVQMPDLVVEQAPTNSMGQESCIVKLEAAVKQCLAQNNIDVPDVMSAFEAFNDAKSRQLCAAEDAIFNCAKQALNDCGNSNDAVVAKEMLWETAQTVQSMCELRQPNVLSGQRQDGANVQGADTMATVENVDAIPTDVKASPTTSDKQEITIIEERPALADTPSAESVKEAIQHEVHVQELRMKEYLLPILVGAGIGFMVLVLFLSLMICCCCKRRFRRKMKMAKEMEKPPLKDGIYTIGIPPPTYETNGIPPMYYEEAKGEKITSRSPAVLEGSEQQEGEGTQM